MTKKEFLKILEKKLNGLPKEERNKSLAFYSEILDDKIEEGLTEEQAVASLGNPEKIAEEILGDSRSVPKQKEKKNNLAPWIILALILGFPLWFPLLIASLIVLLAGVIVLFALLFSLAAIQFSLLVGGVGALIQAFVSLFTGNFAFAIVMLGTALLLPSLFLLLHSSFLAAEKFLLSLFGKLFKGIAHLFTRQKKED